MNSGCGNQTVENVRSPKNFKLPSDTTLYSPGLRKATSDQEDNLIEKISNFVENIRLENNRRSVSSGGDMRRVIEQRKNGHSTPLPPASNLAHSSRQQRNVHGEHAGDTSTQDPGHMVDQLLVQVREIQGQG